jgi:hypothetical protein
MATYKVLQDIEAEDKLVGPLTFRQCVYAGVAIMCLYLCYLVSTHHAAFLLVALLPPALFCLFFAVPWQKQQSTEVWALAKIRFFFKPRKRIWDQSGIKELVTITVPKHVEVHYTDGLSQTEVSSRLKALAETIDSRGWAIKNVPMNNYNQPVFADTEGSDRLMGIDDFAQEVPNFDESAAPDVLDTQNNPIAQQFDQMMTASKQVQRQHIMDEMHQASQPHSAPGIATQGSSAVPYWFTQQYGNAAPASAPGVLPQVGLPSPALPAAYPSVGPAPQTPTLTDNQLLDQLHATSQNQALSSAHMRTIQPLHPASGAPLGATNIGPQPYAQPYAVPAAAQPVVAPVQPVTLPVDPAILNLANNNDLNVATIAREANKHSQELSGSSDEVVISLH